MKRKTQGDDNDAGRRNAARVRDNQRRARERHKAYVEDLQRRVKDYEQRSTLATLEMQQAARAVAAENAGLRLLLRQRGVGAAEVDQFLQSLTATDTAGGNEGRRPVVAGGGVRKSGRPSTTTGQRMPVSSQGTRSRAPLVSAGTPHTPDRLAVLADATVQQDCCGGRTQCTLKSDGPGAENSGHAPSASIDTTMFGASPEPPSASDSPPQRRSPTTMSCTEAAEIVAKMHGHGDSDLAKAALGCGNQPECVVKNTALFQVLEGGGDGV